MGRVAGILVALLVSGSIWSIAPAVADESSYAEFYTPPQQLPDGQPGDLIRTEPSRLVLEPSGQLGSLWPPVPVSCTAVPMRRGNPIAVTGTFIAPTDPWTGTRTAASGVLRRRHATGKATSARRHGC